MPKIKAREEKAADLIDIAALAAQERITKAAERAQALIEEACVVATQMLETSSRVPDKRNLNGSFQWDRGDRYRRGSDERISRLEDKVNGIHKAEGDFGIGAAQRIEQILSIRAEIVGLSNELDTKKLEMEHLAQELANSIKELSSRMDTQHELILSVKDGVGGKIDAIKDELEAKLSANETMITADKIRNQQYVIGIVVGLIVTFITSVLFGYLRV